MAEETQVAEETMSDNQEGEQAEEEEQEEQLVFDFVNQVADAVWDAKMDLRAKGLKRVMEGFAMMGCLHVAVSSVLNDGMERLPELKRALEEEAARKKGKG